MKVSMSFLAFAALFAAASVQADTATSTANSEAIAPSIKEKLNLNLWSNFAGPAVNNFNEVTPGSTPDDDDRLSFDNVITSGYKLQKTFEVGAAIELLYKPMGTLGKEFSNDVATKDIWLRANRSKILDSNGLDLSVDLRVYTPSPNRNNLVTGFRSTQNFNWTYGDLTLGTYSFFRANVYTTAPTGKYSLDEEKGLAFHNYGSGSELRRLYIAPNGSYAITKNLQATLWADLVSLRYRAGDSRNYLGKNDPIDIEPGLNWDITDKVALNPYVNFYTDNLGWDNTYVGFIFTAKAF